jgi:phage shock protein PspC (stress-responsive transcriptional regulator)
MTTPPFASPSPSPDADRPALGASTMTAPPSDAPGRSETAARSDSLRRGGPDRMLAGVAVGLAHYFDIDPTLVRVGFVVLSFLGGLAVPLYLAGWLLIPEVGAEQSVAEELLARERIR